MTMTTTFEVGTYITDTAELDVLPVGTRLTDADGPLVKREDGKFIDVECFESKHEACGFEAGSVYLPATITVLPEVEAVEKTTTWAVGDRLIVIDATGCVGSSEGDVVTVVNPNSFPVIYKGDPDRALVHVRRESDGMDLSMFAMRFAAYAEVEEAEAAGDPDATFLPAYIDSLEGLASLPDGATITMLDGSTSATRRGPFWLAPGSRMDLSLPIAYVTLTAGVLLVSVPC